MLLTPSGAFVAIAAMFGLVGMALASHRYFEIPARNWTVSLPSRRDATPAMVLRPSAA